MLDRPGRSPTSGDNVIVYPALHGLGIVQLSEMP